MCPAPSTAYYNNANAKPTIENGVDKVETLAALNLYGTAEDIKSLFYLDGIVQFAKNANGTLEKSFVGYVLDGSPHVNRRPSSRIYPVHIPGAILGILQDAQLLNDAGLNTYASISNFITTNFAANPAVSALFTSSYYSSTTYGFLIQKWLDTGSGEILENNYDYNYTIPQQSSENRQLVLDMALPPSGSVAYEVFAYAENEEGRVYSPIRFDLEAREQTATYQASAVFLPNGPGVSGAISLQLPAWKTMQFEYEIVYVNADDFPVMVTLAITIQAGETQGSASQDVDNYDDDMGDSNNKTENIQERRIFERTNSRHYPQI